MNVLTKIESDHQEIRSLIKAVENSFVQEPSAEDAEYEKLKKWVLIHHEAEQSTLLNELVQYNNSRNKAMHLVEEHGEHKKIIEQMNKLIPQEKNWEKRFKELRHDLIHHIEEEEKDLFKVARETLDDKVLQKLGRDMVIATAEVTTNK